MFPPTGPNLRGAQTGTLKNYGIQAPKGLSFHLFKGPTVSSQPYTATAHFDVGYYPAADMSQRKPRADWYTTRSPTPAPPAPKMYSLPRSYQTTQYSNSDNVATSNSRGPEPHHAKQRSSNFSIYPSVGKDTYIYEASDIYSNSEFSSSTTTLAPSESVCSPQLSTDSLTLQNPLAAPTSVDPRRPPSRSSTPAPHSSFPLHIPALAQAQSALRGLFANNNGTSQREGLGVPASERAQFPSREAWTDQYGQPHSDPVEGRFPDFDVELDPVSRRNTEINASTSYNRNGLRNKRDSLSAPMHHSQAANAGLASLDSTGRPVPSQPDRLFDDGSALRSSPEQFEPMTNNRAPTVPGQVPSQSVDQASIFTTTYMSESNHTATAQRISPTASHESSDAFSILQPPLSQPQPNSNSEGRRTYASVVISSSPTEARIETASIPSPPRSSLNTTSAAHDGSGSAQHRSSVIPPQNQPRYEHEAATSTNYPSDRNGNAESSQFHIYASGSTAQTAPISNSVKPQIQTTTQVPSNSRIHAQAQLGSVERNGIAFPESRRNVANELSSSSQSHVSGNGSTSDNSRVRTTSTVPSLPAAPRADTLPRSPQEQTSHGRLNATGISMHVEDARVLEGMPRATNSMARRPSMSNRSSSNSPPTHFQPTAIIAPRDADYATVAAQAAAAQEARARTFSTASMTTSRPHGTAGFRDSMALPPTNTVPTNFSERSSPPQARAPVAANQARVAPPPIPSRATGPVSQGAVPQPPPPPPRSHTPFGEPKRRHSDDDNPSLVDATYRSATPFRTEFVPTISGSNGNYGRRPEPHRSSSDGDQADARVNINLPTTATANATRNVRWNDNLICPSPIFPEQRRKGWFNRRGDQLWTNSGYFKSPALGHEYPIDLDEYPDYGQGWMNEQGVRIDMDHRLIPKPPLRSALKRSCLSHC